MTLKKKTIDELEALLSETKLKFREKLRSIQSVIDEKKRDDEMRIIREKAEKYDLLLERRQLDKNKSETRNDQQSVASVSLNLG